MTRSQCCIGSVGAKVLARNVIGKSTVNITPLTASTERISEPIKMPNQIMPNPNTRISPNASTASATLPRIRHPMHRPVTAITTTPIDECSRLATLRPMSTADLRIGSDSGGYHKRGENDCLRLDSRQQELAVGRASPGGDRRTEHECEQQDKHD